ncbi:hypothetical protein H4Q26_001427 [Puccinia striiformis f. sp. tritici PST-130]|nr:hypothetical protein H4Q26_001427 [Puccinia striiformis f. sp. tritici PST-130]
MGVPRTCLQEVPVAAMFFLIRSPTFELHLPLNPFGATGSCSETDAEGFSNDQLGQLANNVLRSSITGGELEVSNDLSKTSVYVVHTSSPGEPPATPSPIFPLVSQVTVFTWGLM